MKIDSTKRVNVGSLKNIDIRLSYGPKSHSLTNRAEIVYGNSRDYYLSIGVNNLDFKPYLPFSIFWGLKREWPPMSLGPRIPTKN